MTTQSEVLTPDEAPAITPPVNLGRRLSRFEARYSQAMLDNVAKDAYIDDCHEHIQQLEAKLAELHENPS